MQPHQIFRRITAASLVASLTLFVGCTAESGSPGSGSDSGNETVSEPGTADDTGVRPEDGRSDSSAAPHRDTSDGRDFGGVDAASADWSCLDSVSWARADESELDYAGRAVRALDGEGLGGVPFEVCASADDPSCSRTILEGTTDEQGSFTGTIPMGADRKGFDGYLRIPARDGRMETLVFFNPPITEDRGEPVRMPVVTRSVLENAAGMTMGIEPDPERGQLAVEALDCTWSRTAGVEVDIDAADEETSRAYMRNGAFPARGADQTDSSGLVGFFNVPPGRVVVTARVRSTGERIGSVEVFVEAGAVSEVPVAPTPSQ